MSRAYPNIEDIDFHASYVFATMFLITAISLLETTLSPNIYYLVMV